MNKRFAFIDVQNTETTTRRMLGFSVDWMKLFQFLKNDWKCEKVFFYSGIDAGDSEMEKEFKILSDEGCIVRSKLVFAYKNKNKTVDVKCHKCGSEFEEVVDMGYNRKSNCDVDLTVDAMECAGLSTEFYLFTGDGDFEYLIKKVVEKGTFVHIVSSAKKAQSGPRYSVSRFSTKLRKLIKEKGKSINFLNIDNLKFRIKKEKAAKRDLF
ncbi:MAG: NYN domain-containing protein [Candidatus Staskawiczbacteria bacterium]|nr:NYN domain-containing protein [Candidatus Staskawiczbacteria bacterium]